MLPTKPVLFLNTLDCFHPTELRGPYRHVRLTAVHRAPGHLDATTDVLLHRDGRDYVGERLLFRRQTGGLYRRLEALIMWTCCNMCTAEPSEQCVGDHRSVAYTHWQRRLPRGRNAEIEAEYQGRRLQLDST